MQYWFINSNKNDGDFDFRHSHTEMWTHFVFLS